MITLLPVPGFGSYPDGRLRAGPFNLRDISTLHEKMLEYGITPGTSGDRAMVSSTPNGLMISASGAGVRGYFLDDENIEVGMSDMDELVLDCVRPGTAFRITGHCCPNREKMIISEAMAFHDGMNVEWSRSRMIHHSDGSVQPIGAGLGYRGTSLLRAV